MKLIDEWKHCWKWISMWCMTGAGAVQGAWMFIPEDMKASISHEVVQGVTIALMVLGVIGRLVDQGTAKK